MQVLKSVSFLEEYNQYIFCLLYISIRLFIKDIEVVNTYNAYFSS